MIYWLLLLTGTVFFRLAPVMSSRFLYSLQLEFTRIRSPPELAVKLQQKTRLHLSKVMLDLDLPISGPPHSPILSGPSRTAR